MDFQFNEDQRAIADMAGALFSDVCTDDRLRAADTRGEGFFADLWEKCVETGLHALSIPEDAGGSGLGMTDLMLVLEAQGRALGHVPLWQHQLAAMAVARFGGAAGHDLVAAASAGEKILTLSLHGLARSGGDGLQAAAGADGLIVNGRVPAVPFAAEAAAALLLAATPAGNRLLLVVLDQPAVNLKPGLFTDGASVADVTVRDLAVPAACVLPAEAVQWLEDRAMAALASMQLGVSCEQIRRTVAYVSERKQFDRAIGSFQAVQMSMADAHIATEALRSALYQLVFRLDAGYPSQSEALATRWLACEAGHSVGHKAQHVHGGIGVDLTYPIHRYLYWSRALAAALGGSAATLERLGTWITTNNTLGWKYDFEENQAV